MLHGLYPYIYLFPDFSGSCILCHIYCAAFSALVEAPRSHFVFLRKKYTFFFDGVRGMGFDKKYHDDMIFANRGI